jgi:hypothetical protein
MARIPSSSTAWSGNWNPKEDFGASGPGFIGEGKVVELRFHSLQCKSDVHRYMALVVDVSDVHKRTFGKYGDEVNPNFKKDINSPNKVSFDQVLAALGKNSGSPAPPKVLDQSYLSKLHPEVKGRFEFWANADQAKNISIGDEVLFKTDGESIVLFNVAVKSHSKFSTMKSGEGELYNQVSKVADVYDEDAPLAQDLKQGAADDEWDD